mmetsp:Transcript_46163/g.122391  ORF Transcript_46163/g.122391 Transcript_46163/m.122391 type:complete len:196 (-) Transcript_46163:41-628(-)
MIDVVAHEIVLHSQIEVERCLQKHPLWRADVSAAVPALDANVRLNVLEDKVSAALLDWARAEQHIADLPRLDLVVAADTVWVPGLAPLFVNALAAAMKGTGGSGDAAATLPTASESSLHTQALLCHRTRSHLTDRVLWDHMKEAGLEWSTVPDEELHQEFKDPDVRVFSVRLHAASSSRQADNRGSADSGEAERF